MQTLLEQISAFSDDCPVKKAILKNIANKDVRTQDSKGNTLLNLALQYLDLTEDITKQIIDLGSLVNAANYSGCTPLQKALKFRNCQLPIIKLLINRGADVKATNDRQQGVLIYALSNPACPTDVIKFLCEKGADINNVDSFGYSLLHHAIRSTGSLITLQTILDLGVDPYTADVNGTTPLSLAVMMNRADIVGVLLRLPKIKVNLADKQRLTPLHRAIAYKEDINPRIVKLLLEAGANSNKQAKYKEQSLHLAADFCQPTVIRLLLDHGARVNVLNKEEQSPLYKMINISNHYSRVSAKMLLDAGALVFEDHPMKKLYPRDSWPFNAISTLHHAVEDYCQKYRTPDQMERVLLLLKYGLLEKPDLCYKTFQVDKQTRRNLKEFGDRCMEELQTICMEPNITLAQFILRSRFREEEYEDESLTDDVLEILSSKSYPLYKEVVGGLLDRDDLMEAFQRHSLYAVCGKSRTTLGYDCAYDAAMYLGVEDLLNLLLTVYKPKKKDTSFVKSPVQTESVMDLIEIESQRFFKRARIN